MTPDSDEFSIASLLSRLLTSDLDGAGADCATMTVSYAPV
jgi:hypothetical protein